MDGQNKELLNKVLTDRLNKVLSKQTEAEEGKQAFKEAMDASSRLIEIEKIEVSHQETVKQMEAEEKRDLRNETVKISEAQKDRIVQVGIFVAGMVVSPLIERWVKMGYAKILCEFEKDYTFTTAAGKSLSGLFRFKK